MDKKSLEHIDLARIIKNADAKVEIECLYENQLRCIVDAHYGHRDKCYLRNNGGVAVYKRDCYPTRNGWREIKHLKKIANNLSGFKKGEWILYKANITQIIKMDYGLIQQVGDGMNNSAGYELNDYCFKLTAKKKIISEHIQCQWQIVNKAKPPNLKYDNVHTILMEFWKQMMMNIENDQPELNDSFFNELDIFINGIIGKRHYRHKKYCGLNLWR